MSESHANDDLTGSVRRAAGGDERAQEVLYHRFKTPLYNLACRYTGDEAAAEDILQEVFLKAFAHLSTVNDAARFPGWIFRIAVNTCLSHIRSRKAERRSSVPLSQLEEVVAARVEGEADMARRRSLEGAIQALPEKLKSVFLLHDVEGFKHEEIADILGCAVGTSKSNLFKARLKLRDHLANPRRDKE
jgi:RNA polymerase sigma-70 factor (ECF subfamily)